MLKSKLLYLFLIFSSIFGSKPLFLAPARSPVSHLSCSIYNHSILWKNNSPLPRRRRWRCCRRQCSESPWLSPCPYQCSRWAGRPSSSNSWRVSEPRSCAGSLGAWSGRGRSPPSPQQCRWGRSRGRWAAGGDTPALSPPRSRRGSPLFT